MARITWIALWASVSLLLLGGGCSDPTAPDGGSGKPAAAAELAPDFELERLEGGRVRLSELRGKTVIVDFWATWCPPCEFQVPELNAVFEAHRASGELEVFGISVDIDGPEVVSTWKKEKGARYPILLGDEDLARRYGAMGFPTLVIIAPDGSIARRHVGIIERDELEQTLAELRSAESS